MYALTGTNRLIDVGSPGRKGTSPGAGFQDPSLGQKGHPPRRMHPVIAWWTWGWTRAANAAGSLRRFHESLWPCPCTP